MKTRYSPRLKATIIEAFGWHVTIEFRSRLKCYDLVFYPLQGQAYGQRQYFDKYTVRSDDFISLMAIIIKATEMHATESLSFYECLKVHGSEYVLTQALGKMAAPAHSSADANSI